jgi:D-glycero-alpha-D-manno-heptose-7-phosphate kinase
VIITRSPLRISLGGGGTDLPSYYRRHGGFVIAAAIDKFVLITLHRAFVGGMILKYSNIERVETLNDIQHPLIREAMRLTGTLPNFLEITSLSDIPSGTGLGSSGSFLTALLHALHTYNKKLLPRQELAEQACHIEIDVLKEPVGKQDQYIATFGGIVGMHFHQDDTVEIQPVPLGDEILASLEDNLALFFTGYTRSASKILQEQNQRSKELDPEMLEQLHFVKQLGQDSLAALVKGDLRGWAEIMNVHWRHKKKRSADMSNSKIDEWYELGLKAGAIGGKIIGAGGGGFLMFYSEDKTRLRHAMYSAGLKEVRMRFDFEGTKVVTQS